MKVGTSVTCAHPECSNIFVATAPNQLFCRRKCTIDAYRLTCVAQGRDPYAKGSRFRVISYHDDPQVAEDLKFLADDEGVPISTVQRWIVADWLKNHDVMNGVPHG